MAKDSRKQDEIPIRFEIPTGWKAIQFGRVPNPVNQPNWKYKRPDAEENSFGSLIFAGLFTAFSVFILLLGISETSVMGIIVGAFLSIVGCILIGRGINSIRNERLQGDKTKGDKKSG